MGQPVPELSVLADGEVLGGGEKHVAGILAQVVRHQLVVLTQESHGEYLKLSTEMLASKVLRLCSNKTFAKIGSGA